MKTKQISVDFKEKLGLQYSPVGFYFAENRPDAAIGFKKSGSGCIVPLILTSAKGKKVAFDENTCGWACSAFHLGYKDGIFPGIEYFLSNGFLIGRTCERFVKTPALARKYIKSVRFQEKSKGVAVFKPLEDFNDTEKPEIVIFFANPDQLSALTFLLYFSATPDENRVVTKFTSGCGSMVTLPLKYARNGERKAVWGLHDISARTRMPKDLMTMTMPFEFLVEIWQDMDKSFLITDTWGKILQRSVVTD